MRLVNECERKRVRLGTTPALRTAQPRHHLRLVHRGALPRGQTPATRTSSPGGRATPRRGAGGSGRNPSAGPPDTSTHPSPTSPGQAAQPIIFVLFNICFCALSVCDLDNWIHFIAIVSWRYSLPVDCD